MRKYTRSILVALVVIFFVLCIGSCRNGSTPKPRAYYRIDFPEKQYQLFDTTFPYSFMYPTYAKVVADNTKGAEKYWINVDFPGYKARIHLSYKSAEGRLDSLLEDSRKLTYKHVLKADAINERIYANPEERIYGILYNIKGNAASSWQFFVTDSSKHFLRGALYFSTTPNKDSLAPAIDFFGQDLIELIETLKWKELTK